MLICLKINIHSSTIGRVMLVAKETNKFGQKEANIFQNNVIYKKFESSVAILLENLLF